MKVQICNKSKNPLPKYETENASGMDIMMWKDGLKEFDKIIIPPRGRAVVPTGLYVAIPQGFEFQIRPRSGLAAKKGISVMNTPGTIDADYRGEIKVIIVNHSDETVGFVNGEKICQMVLCEVPMAEWEEVKTVEELPITKRGDGGFGHTDAKKAVEEINNIMKDAIDVELPLS